jgi:hypothetical protein
VIVSKHGTAEGSDPALHTNILLPNSLNGPTDVVEDREPAAFGCAVPAMVSNCRPPGGCRRARSTTSGLHRVYGAGILAGHQKVTAPIARREQVAPIATTTRRTK